MTAYFDELCRAMSLVAEHPRSVFMGQAVACAGTAMRRTLEHLPADRLLELPVAEDMQMGMATGMALGGFLPVCIFPRWNFLLLAASQLILHLDKIPLYSAYRPRVIIRTAVATRDPLDPGPQHLGDFSAAHRLMLDTVRIVRLQSALDIVPYYREAMERDGSTLLVEKMELY